MKGQGTRLWLWVFWTILAGYAAVLLASPHPPMLQDYPDWVYQGVLFAKLLAHQPAPGYALKHFPVPNSLTTVGVGVLTWAVGWQAAAKLWLVLVLGAFGAACVHFVRRIGGDNEAVLPVFASAVITGLDFWNGSINFQLSLAFLLVLLAHLLRPEARPWKTAVLLLLCFFTHMLPCGAGLLALTALALQQRNWRRLLPAAPTLVCVAWYALARDPNETPQAPLHLVPAMFALLAVLLWTARNVPAGWRKARTGTTSVLAWPPVVPLPVLLAAAKVMILFGWIGPMNMLTSNTGSNQVLWPLAVFWGLSAVGMLAACVGIWTLGTTWRGLIRSDDPRRFLAVTAVGLAVMYLLLPSYALGVTAIDSRFLHLAIAVGLGLVSLRRCRWVNALAALAVFVGTVNLLQFAAVQFQPTVISVPLDRHVLLGGSPVAPGVRSGYYRALAQGRFQQWIFPTALFRWTPR